MDIEEIFKWRETSEEKPFYKEFGNSNEVVGVDALRTRSIYIYSRGVWFLNDSWERPAIPPIYWHYLPQRPPHKEIKSQITKGVT